MDGGFDLAEIQQRLRATVADEPYLGEIHHVASTDSTNTLALEAAQAGQASGVWVADEQTAGRGRGGHAWHSAVGDGLYMSVLVRPRLFGAAVLQLSLAAGLACSRALKNSFGIEIDLRWPNDLMVRGHGGREKKFGGILTESAMAGGDGALKYAVIGIGMNLNNVALPEDLRDVATSLRIATGEALDRANVLVAVLRALAVDLRLLDCEVGTGQGGASLAARFEQASTWVRDLAVHVSEGDGYTGVTDGLDPHGLLRVRLDDGTLRTVRHGGVRRLHGS